MYTWEGEEMTVLWFIIGLVVGFALGAVGLKSSEQWKRETEDKARLDAIWRIIEAEIKKGRVN